MSEKSSKFEEKKYQNSKDQGYKLAMSLAEEISELIDKNNKECLDEDSEKVPYN